MLQNLAMQFLQWLSFALSFLLPSLAQMYTGFQFSPILLATTWLKKWNTLGSGQEAVMW